MAITPLPDPPSRGDPTSFAERGDKFMAALPLFADEANALQVDVNQKQAAVTASAAAAADSETAAGQSRTAAEAAAVAAAASQVAASDSEADAASAASAAATSADAAQDSAAQAAGWAAAVDSKNLSTDYAGATEPPVKWPYMTWADTGNMLLKRRNAANTAWVVEGVLLGRTNWFGTPVSGVILIWTHLAGAEVPPTNIPGLRYVKLTADDPYNAGVLSGETVSGASPRITATATISLADSPLNGGVIRLVNTERRYFRAGTSGVVLDSALQDHEHRSRRTLDGATLPSGGTGYDILAENGATDATAITGTVIDGSPSFVAAETRPYTVQIEAYLRIL